VCTALLALLLKVLLPLLYELLKGCG